MHGRLVPNRPRGIWAAYPRSICFETNGNEQTLGSSEISNAVRTYPQSPLDAGGKSVFEYFMDD